MPQAVVSTFTGSVQRPQRFSASLPDRPHSVAGTLRFLDEIAREEGAARYVQAFVARSHVLRQMDQSCPPLLERTATEETFPHLIVRLSRVIPAYPHGGQEGRAEFIASNFLRSQTFMDHVREHGLDHKPEDIKGKPSALWALHRAFQELRDPHLRHDLMTRLASDCRLALGETQLRTLLQNFLGTVMQPQTNQWVCA